MGPSNPVTSPAAASRPVIAVHTYTSRLIGRRQRPCEQNPAERPGRNTNVSAAAGLHRAGGLLLAGEFFRTDLCGTTIARWRGRGERVAGLLLTEQLTITDLGEVPVAVMPTALRRLLLGRFLHGRLGASDRGTVTVARQAGGRADHLDGLLGVHAIAELRYVTMDFGRVEIAHELQYLAAEHLAGYQNRKTGRVGRYISRRYDVDRRLQPFIDLLTGEVFAIVVVVGEVERSADIPFGRRLASAVIQECGVEAAEIGQRQRHFGKPINRLLEVFALTETHLGDVLVELARDVDQNLHQESDRAACGADIGHEQHAVARRLVDLN